MRYRRLLAAACLAGLAIAPTSLHALTESEKQDVIRVEAYINSIRTMRTDFTQIAPNGAVAQGHDLHIPPRPAARRISPAGQAADFCHAAMAHRRRLQGQGAAIFAAAFDAGRHSDPGIDPAFRRPFGQRSQAAEPLALGPHRRNKATDKGSINLIFQINPFQLTGWTVIDHQGKATQVTFENTQVGTPLDPSLFGYVAKCD